MNTTDITVDEAIKKGNRWVKLPVAFILIFGVIACFVLVVWLRAGPVWLVSSFFFGIVPSMIYWAFAITKWKLWAFERVRNVHTLREMAELEGLFYPEGSLTAKMEFWSANDKNRWQALRVKFDWEDEFTDDPNVPAEIQIYQSKIEKWLNGLSTVAFFGGAIFLLVNGIVYPMAAALFILGIYSGYRQFKARTFGLPQIIISENGIQTRDRPFFTWAQVAHARVERFGIGKNMSFKLVYEDPEGMAFVDLNDLEVTAHQLTHLLKVYQARYRLNNSPA